VKVAEERLAAQRSVTPVDVFNGLGWLPGQDIDKWRQGRLPALENATAVGADKLLAAVTILREWAAEKGLPAHEASYVAAARDRQQLRFTCTGDDAAERAFRTQWISAELSPARQEKLVERQNKAPDLVALIPVGDWTCVSCGGTGDHLVMENGEPLCLTCADLDHLRFLPAGNAALSLRAKKASGLSAVVMQFNRRRKRYERRGVLVEQTALEQAEEQCLSDEDARARRRERDQERRAAADVDHRAEMAREITRLFPRCPAERAEAIALHAGERSSGRVGRSAAARALDENALTLAVIASVRHLDTDYDELLMTGVPRREARDRIRPRIEEVLTRWRGLP
jgi:hypothetical protein